MLVPWIEKPLRKLADYHKNRRWSHLLQEYSERPIKILDTTEQVIHN
jgi:hypothetical protein